jgi:hypothetical protein
LEIVETKFRIKNKKIAVFSYYNAPNKKLELEFFKYVKNKFKNFLILGDLNAKSRRFNTKTNRNGQLLDRITDELNLSILNDKWDSTNFRKIDGISSNSVIDYGIGSEIFTKHLESYKTMTGSLLSAFENLYYHVPIKFTFKIQCNVETNKSHNKSLLYSKANWTKYKLQLDVQLNEINENETIDEKSDKLSFCYQASTLNSIPMSNSNPKERNDLPGYIHELIKTKKRWQRRYNCSGTLYDREILYSTIDAINIEIRNFRSQQWQEFIKKLGPHPLSSIPFWKRIDRYRNKKRSNSIGTIVVEDKELKLNNDKANAFAENLSKTFSEDLNVNYNQSHKQKVEKFFTDSKMDKMYSNEQKLLKPLFTTRELDDAIRKVNNKTSHDHFGISNMLLKHSTEKSKVCLLNIFNECLIKNYIPVEWRTSIVTMLVKKGADTKNVKSYRPISVTSCIARLFERLILKRLQKFLGENHVIIDQQSGFRSHRQTKDNLLFLGQKVKEAFQQSRSVLCVFFDIAGAFDKVWHQGLLYKLYQIKTPYYLVKIIEQFLTNRTFAVKVGDYKSTRRSIQCSVPQGGVLSPTLFSLYINDVPAQKLKNKRYTIIFADDIMYFETYKTKTPALERRINKYLFDLECWTNKWRLTLAPHKSCYLNFTNKHMSDDFALKLYGNEINKESDTKFLGVKFDDKLKFTSQIDYLIDTCNKRINILKALAYDTWKISNEVLINLYKSLIRSPIEYSSFFITSNQTNLDKLQVIQNNAFRAILRIKWEDHVTIDELHHRLQMVTIKDRLNELNDRYINKCFAYQNPMTIALVRDYEEFKSTTRISKPTLLCGVNYRPE